MSSLSRIFLVGYSKSLPFSNRYMSSAATCIAGATVTRYPLGKDLSWLPMDQRNAVKPSDYTNLVKGRPVSLLYRVLTMIELSDFDGAVDLARLSVLEDLRGRDDTILICNAVIEAMCNAKRLEEGIALFDYFFNDYSIVPNIVSFNHVIKAFCDLGRVDDALQLYRHAAQFGADKETYKLLTQALVDSYGFSEAEMLVGLTRCLSKTKDWTPLFIVIRDRLDKMNVEAVNGYFRRLRSEYDSKEPFESVVPIFVDYWFKHGNEEKAMECYSCIDTCEDVSLTTRNTLLGILLANGKKTEAWVLFNLMFEEDKCFDLETINIMVDGLFKLGEFNKAMETFNKSQERQRMVGCYSNMIARLCERGMVSEAEVLFEEMSSHKDLSPPDVSTFRSMVSGYVRAGRVDDAIKISNKLAFLKLRKVSIYED